MQWTIYVIMNTNNMAQALRRRGSATEAAQLACQTFRSLLIDPEFRDCIENMFSTARQNRQEIHRQLYPDELFPKPEQRSPEYILKEFLEQERKLMIEADLDEEIANDVVMSVMQNLDQLSIGNLEPEKLFKRLRDVKVATCGLARRLGTEAEEVRWKSKVKKLATGLGGAGLIGLNVSALAASVGIGVVGAALSGAIGATALQLGTDWLKEYL